MDDREYKEKYANLRILKSVQEYLKSVNNAGTAIYPIKVPDDLLIQVLQSDGPEEADELIHEIFRLGLSTWSEKFYNENFGSEEDLQEFIELVKKRNRK